MSGNLISFAIESTGRIVMQLDNGLSVPVAWMTLNDFINAPALKGVGRNLYEETGASGKIQPSGYWGPATDGLGALRTGFLELSNVDLATEFTDMIRSQRGLQANSRSITTSDEILQELINLKR